MFAIEFQQVRAFVKHGFFGKFYDRIPASLSLSEAEEIISKLRNSLEECDPILDSMLDPNLIALSSDVAETVASAQVMNLNRIVAKNVDYLQEQDAVLVVNVDRLVEDYRLAENKVVLEAIARARGVGNIIVEPQLSEERLLYNLSQWFCRIGSEFDLAILAATGWRSSPANRAPNSVSRMKKIEIHGVFSVCANLVLQKDANDNRISILPQLQSKKGSYLPQGLQLIVLDEFGQIFNMAKAVQGSNLLQLNSWLDGDPGTIFSVRVALGKASVTESFCI